MEFEPFFNKIHKSTNKMDQNGINPQLEKWINSLTKNIIVI